MYFCSISALNLSKEKGFQGGICGATLLMLITLEEKGDIGAAFLLAVSLKATHFEVIAIFFLYKHSSLQTFISSCICAI